MGVAGDLGTVKGAALRSFILWYEANNSAEDREADLQALPEDLRLLLDPSRDVYGVIVSKWYPMGLLHALVDRMRTRRSPSDLDALARRSGPEVLQWQMSGIQKRAFRLLMNPARYLKHVQTLWRQNFDSGEIEVLDLGPQEHHGFTRNWRGHHPIVCRIIHTGKRALYENMGCNDVTVELTGCISDHAEACSSRVRWSP
jgi:hypothetical protein